jgi:hydroxymethylpyrimidine pyrophosphatase-like HAD family hydrolase
MEAFVRRFAACIFDMDGTLCTSRDHPDGHDHISRRTATALQEYVQYPGHHAMRRTIPIRSIL